jgi:hypothetical protein
MTRPSKLIHSFTLNDLTNKANYTKCVLCNCPMISALALHPRICCIKRSRDQDSNSNKFYTSGEINGRTEYIDIWRSRARMTSKYIILVGEEDSDGTSNLHRIVDLDDYTPFDYIHAATRAKACVVDSIPDGVRRFRRDHRRRLVVKILKSSDRLNELPCEIMFAIADI